MNVVALVPAHNEEARVAATVRALRAVPRISRVIVIDDGSTDATATRASEAGAEVVRLERNLGKGAALNAGLAHVDLATDVVLLIDADLGESAREATTLLGPVLEGSADMTVAVLPAPPRSGGVGLVKRLARWGIARLGGGYLARAPLSGQRALSRAAREACTPFAPGFGVEVALTIAALRAGLRVVEVPTAMTHAATGRTAVGFAHRGRQFADVAATLARLATARRA